MTKKLFTFFTLFCLSIFASAQSIEDKLVDRLVEYTSIYTQSEYDVDEVPSTEQQRVLATILAEELIRLGVSEEDIDIDEHSILTATIKGNVENAPTVFISAHLDTSPDLDLQGKAPIPVVHDYEGGDLKINDELTLTQEKNEFLKDAVGGKVITSDGTTLLGGDDKAGMAVVMTLAETFLQDPNIPHGDIRIIFTPDEEVGNSTKYLTKEKINADFGLVLDSHGFGRIVVENFNATDFTYTVTTPPAGHPGYSSNVPALNIANDFVARFPEELAAFNSSGKQGYIGYHKVQKISDTEYKVYGRLRSFELNEMSKYKNKLKQWATKTAEKYGMGYTEIYNGNTIKDGGTAAPVAVLNIRDSYFNSKEVLKNYPTNYNLLVKAYETAGVEMRAESGRGGSDAGDITYLGIPTYNMFAGSHNEHSQDEWVSSKQMLASYNVALNYLTLMGGKDREQMLEEGHFNSEPITPIKALDFLIKSISRKIANQYGNSLSNQ